MGLVRENTDPLKVPDFMYHMPMLYSSSTFSLAMSIVEGHEETSARLP